MSTRKRKGGLAAIAVTFAIAITGCLQPMQTIVYNELMADRTANHLRALPTQGDAQAKAQAWATKLARENKLYHSTITDGMGKVKWCALGENIGYGPDVPSIEDAYMNSPGHKANILSSKWNGVGVGYAVTADGKRVYTVQVFIKTC